MHTVNSDKSEKTVFILSLYYHALVYKGLHGFPRMRYSSVLGYYSNYLVLQAYYIIMIRVMSYYIDQLSYICLTNCQTTTRLKDGNACYSKGVHIY